MAGCDKGASFVLLLLGALHYLLLGASAVTHDVSASGGGLDLSEAMSLAEAGDTVSLANGTYDAALVSHRDGKKDSPITVVGGPGAVVKGDSSHYSVLIKHNFITLKGFSVQGKVGSSDTPEGYVNKCVYVEGSGTNSSSALDGFVMEGLSIENCGAECVRLKDFVVNAVIEGNDIKNCGIYDYNFPSADKNGEGVYIGTSSKLWINGPDACNNNTVKGNRISTSGNECVDIKEGASGNVVENNTCSNQLDANSGCYDSRGDGNVFRNNVGSDCLGAGVRLGGWEVDGHQYGVGNSVYGNDFSTVGNGAVKVLVSNQGDICGNTCEDESCALTGENLSGAADTWNQACGDIGGPSTSSSDSPSTSTPTTSKSRLSSSSPSGTAGDGSESEDETSESGTTSAATPQSEEGGDDSGDDDDDDEDEEKEGEEEEEEAESDEEAGDEDDDDSEDDDDEEAGDEDDDDSEDDDDEEAGDEDEDDSKDDDEDTEGTEEEEIDEDKEKEKEEEEEEQEEEEEDVGDDSGDDSDSDDESQRRGRGLLRGGGDRDS